MQTANNDNDKYTAKRKEKDVDADDDRQSGKQPLFTSLIAKWYSFFISALYRKCACIVVFLFHNCRMEKSR